MDEVLWGRENQGDFLEDRDLTLKASCRTMGWKSHFLVPARPFFKLLRFISCFLDFSYQISKTQGSTLWVGGSRLLKGWVGQSVRT